MYNDLSMIHLQGETIGAATQYRDKGYADVSGKRGLQILVSGLLRIRKQYGVVIMLLHILAFLVCSPIILLISLLRFPFHFSSKELHRDISSLSNIIRLCYYSFPIMNNTHKLYKTF